MLHQPIRLIIVKNAQTTARVNHSLKKAIATQTAKFVGNAQAAQPNGSKNVQLKDCSQNVLLYSGDDNDKGEK